MKIGTKFNQLTYREYTSILKYRHKYTDFNILELYRSIVENTKLDLDLKIAVRELAHEQFLKTLEFLQLKDPFTYIAVSTLGQTVTVADERQLWENIRTNQEKILKKKRIKHRNFGFYSKHICGYEGCPYDGVMIHQNSRPHKHIHFDSDESDYSKQLKVQQREVEKRNFRDSQIKLRAEMEIDQEMILEVKHKV
jgi:hypothetical protein